ncbi:Late competence development protein ComFB [Marinitoga piezophila KA3]|uniref:Late competence development protein ComFB n=1 Tax=Marinitoga piezophila (strain DSM 14283 / JCM 11233 / KA3) TaxID=443254 RepID=H2J3K4_MARPK|nr:MULTISPECIES: late competence development ComFB family protein [Marinitoga]AEX84648.1 Late competence development protein ComFB [Marinitoga piezophila KA3]
MIIEKYHITNVMEHIVEEITNEMFAMPNIDMCICDRCRADVIALALNHLHPKYVVTEKGRLYSELQNYTFQTRAEVLTEVLKAMEKVKEHPSHPKEESIYRNEENIDLDELEKHFENISNNKKNK